MPPNHCTDFTRCFLGALELISYVFDELGAVGVAVSSSYGEGSEASKFSSASFQRTHLPLCIEYIGDDEYDPIWSALDARGAIVFIHGTQTPSSTPIAHPTLGLPITAVYYLQNYYFLGPDLWTGAPRDI